MAYKTGIPDDSCQQYKARDSPKRSCDEIHVCEDCKKPVPSPGESGRERCIAIQNYTRYYASEYGKVSGNVNMKKEISSRGPIECGIMATNEMYLHYKSGIFEEKIDDIELNHSVSVVGYGIENGVEYWVVRNSWGTWWGEDGFMRIRQHINNNGIEMDCSWAVPSYEKPGNGNKISLQ